MRVLVVVATTTLVIGRSIRAGASVEAAAPAGGRGGKPYGSGSRWVQGRLQTLRRRRGGLSDEDSLTLLQEAEQWRWGRSRHNRTADPRRAVELYWAAASGTGPAAAAALFQLGWLHIMPPRLAPAQAIWEPGSAAGGPRSSAVKRHFGDGKDPLVAAGSWEATAVGVGDPHLSGARSQRGSRGGSGAAGAGGASSRPTTRQSSGWVVAAARRYLGVDLTKFWMVSYLKQWGYGGGGRVGGRQWSGGSADSEESPGSGDNAGHEGDSDGGGDDGSDGGSDEDEDLFTLASNAAREYAAASGAHLQLTRVSAPNRRNDDQRSGEGGDRRGTAAAKSPTLLAGVPAAISMATGDPTGRNVTTALALWTHAASLGNPDAQLALATHYTSAAFLATVTEDPPSSTAAAAAAAATAGGSHGSEASSEAQRDVLSVVHGYFAALGGSMAAQMSMGYRYLYGYGVSQDCESALPYYELAANQAVEAIRAAAGRYPGQVVLPPSEALKTRLSELTAPRSARRAGKETNTEVVAFYEAAAMAGDSGAAASLGSLLLTGGRGVPQDVRLAAKIYQRAVDPHGKGFGLDNDDTDSSSSSSSEDGNGAETLAAIKSVENGAADGDANGKGRRRHSSPERKAPAGARDDGDAAAAGILGVLTYAGVGGLVADEAKAAALWRRGETVGDAVALCGLGILHLTGSAVAQPPIQADAKKAVTYFERSGKKGYMDAFFQLGMLHLRWANSDHSEVEGLQKRHRKLVAETQQHQKEAMQRQQQQRHRERARIKASRKRQLRDRADQKQRRRKELLDQRRAARERFKSRMSAEDAAAADAMAVEVDEHGEVVEDDDASRSDNLDDDEEDDDEDDDGDDDGSQGEEGENDAANKAAEEARRIVEKEKQEAEANVARKAKSVAQNLQKGLQYLTTSAQNGHLLSLHQVGVLYQTGRGVSKSCGTAAHAFKSVSERAAEPTATVTTALQLWRDGDMEGARLLYAMAAEMGIETAQSNAAWLLEQAHLHDMTAILADFKIAARMTLASLSKAAVKSLREICVTVGLLSAHDSGTSDDNAATATAATSTFGAHDTNNGGSSEQGYDAVGTDAVNPVACGELDEDLCSSQALRLWRHASKQKNAEAALKVGDYAFFGKGEFKSSTNRLDEVDKKSTRADESAEGQQESAAATASLINEPGGVYDQKGSKGDATEVSWLTNFIVTAVIAPGRLSYKFFQEQHAGGFLPAGIVRRLGLVGDPTSAARHYQAAADLRHPQALWNLGWMYQWGVGVPVDLHLAKRHFDSSAEAHPDAKWPAQIGLLTLRLASFLTSLVPEPSAAALSTRQGEEAKSVERDRSATRPSPASKVKSKPSKKASKSRKGTSKEDMDWIWMDELFAFDTFVMIGLLLAIFLIIQLRNHQREVERQLRRDGAGVAVPPGGGEGLPLNE